MINLTDDNKRAFEKNGWFKTSLNLEKEEIQKYHKVIENLVFKAKINKYPLGRMYHDYLFNYNLAAVEAPLSKNISNENVYNFFEKIKIGKIIKELKKWNNTYCSLIRIFCMGKYNYMGHWHKDNTENIDIVQVSICLKDEKGFKIIKKEFQKDIDEIYDQITINEVAKYKLPLKIEQKYFYNVELKKGEVFFFEPSLLHQGCTYSDRLQFHMRFNNIDDNSHENKLFQHKLFDYSFSNFLSFDLNLKEIIENFANVKRQTIFYRFHKSLNYFFPILNLISYFKQKKIFLNKSKIDFDIFSNTYFQSLVLIKNKIINIFTKKKKNKDPDQNDIYPLW